MSGTRSPENVPLFWPWSPAFLGLEPKYSTAKPRCYEVPRYSGKYVRYIGGLLIIVSRFFSTHFTITETVYTFKVDYPDIIILVPVYGMKCIKGTGSVPMFTKN